MRAVIDSMTYTTHALRMAHWAARGPGSYAFHVASGELVGALIVQIDTLVEAMLRYLPPGTLDGFAIEFPLKNFADRATAVKEVVTLQETLRRLSTTHTEILNIRDEILASIDSFIYKLRFE